MTLWWQILEDGGQWLPSVNLYGKITVPEVLQQIGNGYAVHHE
jgi:hypothetical protein